MSRVSHPRLTGFDAKLKWLLGLFLSLIINQGKGQSIGEMTARQVGSLIEFSVAQLEGVELSELSFQYRLLAEDPWIDIPLTYLSFEGGKASWDVLGCLDVDSFEANQIQFKATLPCTSLEYFGYRYTLVQIGEQCWFAENLKTALYANGDSIAGNLNENEWYLTRSGAQAVYGEGNSPCHREPCDEAVNLGRFGRLYNWYAIADPRGLCPLGWHIGSDDDWSRLEIELGLPISEVHDFMWRGTDHGARMKSILSWLPAWEGNNASGFSGMPCGTRTLDGEFRGGTYYIDWWSTDRSDSTRWTRSLCCHHHGVLRTGDYATSGNYVRCLRDN